MNSKKNFHIIFIFLIIINFSLFSEAEKIPTEPIAVVLGGGGARGAYHIGVWRALKELGVQVGGIYGTSVGAINGAIFAMDESELAEQLWMALKTDEIISLKPGLFGFNVSPLENLLRKYIDEDRVRDSQYDYALSSFNLTDLRIDRFKIEDIPEGKLIDYILASANHPLFERKRVLGKTFLDGGVIKNIDVDLVDSEKYKTVIVVSLRTFSARDYHDYLTDYSDFPVDVIYIGAESKICSMLDFDPENSKKLISMGYDDCMRTFGALE
ncbi:MAG: patatin-like phospholipase family protein [Spirochaetales bacterium]|nr:patatin-like phospholipase family protein [Spirochaetales bacterium]